MDAKEMLHSYLKAERDSLLWKLDGLSERELRLPRTPTGTNLLGLAKHCALVQLGYLGSTFGRPSPDENWDKLEDYQADMYATASESADDIRALYRRSNDHADDTINSLDLDAPGAVPWWPADRRAVTLHRVIVHVTGDFARHGGHADILREGIDGLAGHRPGRSGLPDYDWPGYVVKLTAIADSFGSR